jgi:hypothetical protein
MPQLVNKEILDNNNFPIILSHNAVLDLNIYLPSTAPGVIFVTVLVSSYFISFVTDCKMKV